MKLRDYAAVLGVSEETARRRYRAGKIAGAREIQGEIVVPDGAVKTSMVKLSVWAEAMGVSYKTAWRWYRAGRIPGAFKLGGQTVLVPKPRTTLYLGLKAQVETGPDEDQALANALYAVQKILRHKSDHLADLFWQTTKTTLAALPNWKSLEKEVQDLGKKNT